MSVRSDHRRLEARRCPSALAQRRSYNAVQAEQRPTAMKFGIHNSSWLDSPDPAEAFEAVKAKARWAENCGFAWFSVMDHMIQIPRVGAPDEPELEGWTVLAALAAVTSRIRLATLCTAVGYRNPARLAKIAASVDVISPGRLTLGSSAAGKHEPSDLLACSNRLIDIITGKEFLHTPYFLTMNSVDYAYHAAAQRPWFEQFPDEIFPGSSAQRPEDFNTWDDEREDAQIRRELVRLSPHRGRTTAEALPIHGQTSKRQGNTGAGLGAVYWSEQCSRLPPKEPR